MEKVVRQLQAALREQPPLYCANSPPGNKKTLNPAGGVKFIVYQGQKQGKDSGNHPDQHVEKRWSGQRKPDEQGSQRIARVTKHRPKSGWKHWEINTSRMSQKMSTV